MMYYLRHHCVERTILTQINLRGTPILAVGCPCPHKRGHGGRRRGGTAGSLCLLRTGEQPFVATESLPDRQKYVPVATRIAVRGRYRPRTGAHAAASCGHRHSVTGARAFPPSIPSPPCRPTCLLFWVTEGVRVLWRRRGTMHSRLRCLHRSACATWPSSPTSTMARRP